MRKSVTAAVGLSLFVLCLASSAGQPQTPATFPAIVVFSDSAPLDQFRGQYRPDERAAANPEAWNYLDPRVPGLVQALERQMGFRAEHVYSKVLRGFAARLTAAQIQALERHSWVRSIVSDEPVHISAQSLPWGINRIDADTSSTAAGNGSGAVTNVHLYVVDTGVDRTHPDLFVVNHVNFIGGPNRDCHGHGTHVAGTLAARDNTTHVVGVVPGAPVTGVKVLNCAGSGTVSSVIQGLDWVSVNGALPGVINMSLGTSSPVPLLDLSAELMASFYGFFISVAAGNSGGDACNSSPAAAGAGTNNGVLTMAAIDQANAEASFSNFGPCVDLWGPGVGILSTWLKSGLRTLSGTSMASPHGGGTAALFLSAHPGWLPADVETQLKLDAVTPGTASKDGRSIQHVYAGNY